MVISVASGKGGTGKTLVATNLALSLKEHRRVQLLDCDVEEPNAHIFIKPEITEQQVVRILVPVVDEGKCTHCGICADVCAYKALAVLKNRVLVFPPLCHGCGACGYLCPEKAILEEPRAVGMVELGEAEGLEFVHGRLSLGEVMAPPVIRMVKRHVHRDRTVIIDVPPGTSCPVVEAVRDSDFCLLVTEPTPFGLNDLVLAVGVVRRLGIPCGVVINRAGIGDDKLEGYCLSENIPILLNIPLDNRIAALYSRGQPLVTAMPEWKKPLLDLFDNMREKSHVC